MIYGQNKQRGFVSIVVAALLMIILSLIVAGFTRVMQREQRQAIDRQLSRTALYAAESGVNDVLAAIESGTYAGAEKNDCAPGAIGPNLDGTLVTDGTIAYTCTLYDQTPGELTYDLETDKSKIVRLQPVGSGIDFGALEVSWGQRDGVQNVAALPGCGASAAFQYPANRLNNVPILRLDITKLPSTGASFNRDALLDNTEYLYLVPCSGGVVTPHAFDATTRGDVVAVPCIVAAPQPCQVRIEGLDSGFGTDQLFARIKSVYDAAQVSIDGEDDAGNPIQFEGAQIAVDVTARAGDIVRRLAVSVPFATSIEVPELALQVFDGICKRVDLSLLPGDVDGCNPGPTVTPGSCPSTVATPLTLNFSQSALISAGGNTSVALRSIDVVSDPADTDPKWDLWHYSNPDLDFASLQGYSADAFRVHPDCTYTLDYTVFCAAPIDTLAVTGNTWGTPPIQGCLPDQVNEGMRVGFYSARDVGNPAQCDRSTQVAFFDIEDHFVTNLFPAEFTVTGRAPTITGEGNIVCTELHSSCEESVTHPGCTQLTGVPFSSAFIHSVTWIEAPSP